MGFIDDLGFGSGGDVNAGFYPERDAEFVQEALDYGVVGYVESAAHTPPKCVRNPLNYFFFLYFTVSLLSIGCLAIS